MATLWRLTVGRRAAGGWNMIDRLGPGECQARWRCACGSLPTSKDGGTCDSSHTPATNARRHENRASNSLAKWLQWHRMAIPGLRPLLSHMGFYSWSVVLSTTSKRNRLRRSRGVHRAQTEPRNHLDDPADAICHAHPTAFVLPAQLRQFSTHEVVPAD